MTLFQPNRVVVTAHQVILAKLYDLENSEGLPKVLPVAPYLYANLLCEHRDQAIKTRTSVAMPLRVYGVEIVESEQGWRPGVFLKDGRRLSVGAYAEDPLGRLV